VTSRLKKPVRPPLASYNGRNRLTSPPLSSRISAWKMAFALASAASIAELAPSSTSPSLLAFAKLAVVDVTPANPSSCTRRASVPSCSQPRRRPSSQTLWPSSFRPRSGLPCIAPPVARVESLRGCKSRAGPVRAPPEYQRGDGYNHPVLDAPERRGQ